MEDTKIGVWECIATIGCVNIIPLVLTIPTFTAQNFGTGSMFHTIYSIIIGAISLGILFRLFFKFPGKDFFEISEYAGGKFLKYLSYIIVIAYLLTSTVIVLSEFNENIRNILFKNAPSEYVYLLFIVGMFFGILSGIKGIFRTGMIIGPIILSALLFMFFALFENIDTTNYFPAFGNSFSNFFVEGGFRIEIFEGMFLILLMGGQLTNVKKASIGSFILVSFIVLLVSALLFGIIPYPTTPENYFPFFELSRFISFGRFVQRVEALYTLIWLLAVYLYISLDTSYITQILSKAFNIKYPKRIMLLICMLIFGITLLFKSYITVLAVRKIFIAYVIPFAAFLYSLLIMVIATAKLRRKENEKI